MVGKPEDFSCDRLMLYFKVCPDRMIFNSSLLGCLLQKTAGLFLAQNFATFSDEHPIARIVLPPAAIIYHIVNRTNKHLLMSCSLCAWFIRLFFVFFSY